MANILIVEDDDEFRDVLCSAVKELGHKVTIATDGEAAMDTLKTKSFDLIISDVQMPLVTGLELLAWVKQNIKTPIMLITGYSYIMNTDDAEDIGAVGFLKKPFSFEDLVEELDRVLVA